MHTISPTFNRAFLLLDGSVSTISLALNRASLIFSVVGRGGWTDTHDQDADKQNNWRVLLQKARVRVEEEALDAPELRFFRPASAGLEELLHARRTPSLPCSDVQLMQHLGKHGERVSDH